ncbi:MAG: VOC family protein [Oscillospiraceae bacterium]
MPPVENRPAIGLHSFVLDCKNPAALAQFYAGLLGGRAVPEAEGWYDVFVPGCGVHLSLQRDEDYRPPAWPAAEGQQQMAHLDFMVQNLRQAVSYALSLGATAAPVQFCQPEWEHQWTTLLDPEGHPFCLCLP